MLEKNLTATHWKGCVIENMYSIACKNHCYLLLPHNCGGVVCSASAVTAILAPAATIGGEQVSFL